jgi:lipopolysaccharide transport system permease protein
MAVETTHPTRAERRPVERSAEFAPRRRGAVRSLVDTWRERAVLWRFSVLAFQRMFKMTVLGPTWIVLHVVIDILGKTFLFGNVLSVDTPNGEPYVIFLLSGMLGWRLFQETFMLGIRSFQRYKKFTLAFDLPLPLVPIGGAAQGLLDGVAYFGAVLIAFGYFAIGGRIYFEHGIRLVLVPVGLLFCLLFAWGLSFLLAPLNYRRRDVRLVLRYVIPLWLYVTPVVYPLRDLHGWLLAVAKLNPMAPNVEMIKYGLIGGGNIGVRFFCFAAISAIGTFVIGLVFLNRFGPGLVTRPVAVTLVDDNDDDEDDL